MKSELLSRRAALLLGLTLAMPAAAHEPHELKLEAPWARATVGAARTAAGYLAIVNSGDHAERLVGASSPTAGRVELHEMATVDNVMRMRPLPSGIDIPPGRTTELKPGGLHLMFLDLKAPFVRGTKVPVVLTFEHTGDIRIELEVRDLRAGPPEAGAHGRGHGH
jgi:copper(I)-binding protein